jgi:hypothetical protein
MQQADGHRTVAVVVVIKSALFVVLSPCVFNVAGLGFSWFGGHC